MTSAPGAVTCEPDGLHVAATPRLWIVSARATDVLRYPELADDPDARHWLGWPPGSFAGLRLGLDADPLDDPPNAAPVDPRCLFFAGITRETNRMLAGIVVSTKDGSRYEIGGAVERHHRHGGYGREALDAVVGIVHRHFGVPVLRAGCETTNLASRRWLTGAGFQPAEGPSRYRLPDGRRIDSLWWEHRDEHATARCAHLLPPPRPVRRRIRDWLTGRPAECGAASARTG